jgi:hypothetical protein
MLLLAACAPAPAAPTQDPAEVQRQIQEAVALTVSAQSVQTEQAQALIPEPTNTPLPTQTEAVPPTPLIPTATPFVVVPPPTTAPSTGGGSGFTPVKPDYACDIIHQRPYDDTPFKSGATFDIKWTIVNTGTKTWAKGLDLKYSDGPQMTASGDSPVELPEMKPGDQYEVILDATAPDGQGMQVMVWMLEGGFCYPYVWIIVN